MAEHLMCSQTPWSLLRQHQDQIGLISQCCLRSAGHSRGAVKDNWPDVEWHAWPRPPHSRASGTCVLLTRWGQFYLWVPFYLGFGVSPSLSARSWFSGSFLPPVVLLFYFSSCCTTCGIIVPWPRIESMPPALKMWSLNHWVSRESSIYFLDGIFEYEHFKFNSSIFSFIIFYFSLTFKQSLPNSMPWRFLPVSSKNFMVLALKLRSVILYLTFKPCCIFFPSIWIII